MENNTYVGIRKESPKDGMKYYDYLSTQHSGLYVAFLKDNSDQRSHAVGIKMFRREVYDPSELHIMKFSIESFNQCVGYERTFKAISGLYKIEPESYRKKEHQQEKRRQQKKMNNDM